MVKCSECGFLAIRNRESRVLEETEQITRDEGYLSSAEHEVPVCFMRASDLWAESGLNRGTVCHGNVEVFKATIQKERDCNQFVAWQQGFTPKEHREMMDRERIMIWQTEREEADKKWRVEQEQKYSRDEWKRYIFLAIMTIVGVILGVILGHFL